MTDITNNRIDLSDFEPAAPGVDCTCADGGADAGRPRSADAARPMRPLLRGEGGDVTDKSAEDVRVPAVCECAHPHVDSLDPDDVPCLKCGKRVAA